MNSYIRCPKLVTVTVSIFYKDLHYWTDCYETLCRVEVLLLLSVSVRSAIGLIFNHCHIRLRYCPIIHHYIRRVYDSDTACDHMPSCSYYSYVSNGVGLDTNAIEHGSLGLSTTVLRMYIFFPHPPCCAALARCIDCHF